MSSSQICEGKTVQLIKTLQKKKLIFFKLESVVCPYFYLILKIGRNFKAKQHFEVSLP